VRALRLSGRPPEPGQRFPAELATRLAAAASKALTPTSNPERWLAVLEAAAVSPVRKAVQPEGLPSEADAAFLQSAGAARDKVPGVAALVPDGTRPRPGPPTRRARAAPKPPPVTAARTETATEPVAADAPPADAPPADAPPAEPREQRAEDSQGEVAQAPGEPDVAPSGRHP
jgi:hypothetical protein